MKTKTQDMIYKYTFFTVWIIFAFVCLNIFLSMFFDLNIAKGFMEWFFKWWGTVLKIGFFSLLLVFFIITSCVILERPKKFAKSLDSILPDNVWSIPVTVVNKEEK